MNFPLGSILTSADRNPEQKKIESEKQRNFIANRILWITTLQVKKDEGRKLSRLD
jgi:hypothetical protein